MGKADGFLVFERELPQERKAEERIHDTPVKRGESIGVSALPCGSAAGGFGQTGETSPAR